MISLRPGLIAAAIAAALAMTPMTVEAAGTKSQAHKTMHMDSKVSEIQQKLNASGASLTVDGRMGSKTRAAIVSFQRQNGLKPTGKLDSPTRMKLGAA